MRSILIALIISLLGDLGAFAQNVNPKEIIEERIYTFTDQLPVFPGGYAAIMKFINENLVLSPEALSEKKIGQFSVQFIVNKEGKVKDVSVVKGFSPAFDKAVVEVVEKLPPFIPARLGDEIVNYHFVLPIKF